MMRHVLEKGVASIVARYLLNTRHDALFSAIAKAEALPPEELELLREQTLAQLTRARDEGAPYAEAVMAALSELKLSPTRFSADLSGIGAMAASTAKAAMSHALKTVDDLSPPSEAQRTTVVSEDAEPEPVADVPRSES